MRKKLGVSKELLVVSEENKPKSPSLKLKFCARKKIIFPKKNANVVRRKLTVIFKLTKSVRFRDSILATNNLHSSWASFGTEVFFI